MLLFYFFPRSIELSTEIRQYALFLAFAMGSAYSLERAFANNSAGAMLLSGLSLWLAIGSHFSAFLFAPALGIYAIWRMWRSRPSLAVVSTWIAGQLVAVGLCAFLYFTQIRQLSQYFGGQDATQGWMGNAYLSHSYYIPGKVNPLVFIVGRTIGVFQYVFRQLAVGDLAFILFIVGGSSFFGKRPVSDSGHISPARALSAAALYHQLRRCSRPRISLWRNAPLLPADSRSRSLVFP